MTLYDVLVSNDYDLKIKALRDLLNFLEDTPDRVFVNELLDVANSYESDDYFGTEGLKID